MKFLKREELVSKIGEQNGRFFTIAFRKLDGSFRSLNGRTGVKKHSNGGKLKFDPEEHNLVNLYDVQNKGYRFANLDTAIALNAEHKTYVVTD